MANPYLSVPATESQTEATLRQPTVEAPQRRDPALQVPLPLRIQMTFRVGVVKV